jgi:hypothetical protein
VSTRIGNSFAENWLTRALGPAHAPQSACARRKGVQAHATNVAVRFLRLPQQFLSVVRSLSERDAPAAFSRR